MNVAVYIVKRHLKGKRRNGQRQHKLVLRWKNPATGKWQCEKTGTADMTEARVLQKAKWAEVNGLWQVANEAEPVSVPQPSWQECRDALSRAMSADNLRDSSISDALLLFDAVRRMFPECTSPADFTPKLANEYKRRRAEGDAERGINPVSPWTLRGDLAALKSVFGKWLGRECELLQSNPFKNVKPPKCDDPEVRIVSVDESANVIRWFNERWNNWRLPVLYLEIAGLLGWRATENASLREDDLLADGFVRVAAKSSKTRTFKYGWLPPELHVELRSGCEDGWIFGRFADELRCLLTQWCKRPHHAAKVKEFSPRRMVAWMQDELQRYNELQRTADGMAKVPADWQAFTLHDFRRTAITDMQMAGVSEKEASLMVGATPEVIRRHYEKMDLCAIARRNVERRLNARVAPDS